jgi:hypothetical protein
MKNSFPTPCPLPRRERRILLLFLVLLLALCPLLPGQNILTRSIKINGTEFTVTTLDHYDNYDNTIMLIRTIGETVPCPENKNRKKDDPYKGCLVHHFKITVDTSYVVKEYITDNYAHPLWNNDSTVCYVLEGITGYGIYTEDGYIEGKNIIINPSIIDPEDLK